MFFRRCCLSTLSLSPLIDEFSTTPDVLSPIICCQNEPLMFTDFSELIIV